MSKKKQWLDCGFNILAEKGHEFITVEELSSRMGISRGSFFLPFQKKPRRFYNRAYGEVEIRNCRNHFKT